MAKAEFHEGSFSKVEPLHLTVQESQGSNEVSTFPFISLKFLFSRIHQPAINHPLHPVQLAKSLPLDTRLTLSKHS